MDLAAGVAIPMLHALPSRLCRADRFRGRVLHAVGQVLVLRQAAWTRSDKTRTRGRFYPLLRAFAIVRTRPRPAAHAKGVLNSKPETLDPRP